MSEEKHHPPVARAAAKALCETILAGVIEPVRRAARDAGYAITVHGSVARDIDLVAIPWVEHGVWEPDALVDRIAAVIAGQLGRCNKRVKNGALDWTEMPHGRKATSLIAFGSLFGHIDFDLSVMPRQPGERADG